MHKLAFLVVLAIALSSCSTAPRAPSNYVPAQPKYEPLSHYGNDPYRVDGKIYKPLQTAKGFNERGIASWYGKKFHGKRTSNGEVYDMYQMTAAHKILPLPTYVSVTNVNNDKKIIVRVNDRGPFIGERVIDLSYAAAKQLDLVEPGIGEVKIMAITPEGGKFASREEGKVYIQVGAFSSKKNAKKIGDKLRNFGFDDVGVNKKVRSGNAIYVVRVGPVSKDKDLDGLFHKVANSIGGTPIIVAE